MEGPGRFPLLSRAYRLLLQAYPRRFREAYGADLVRTFQLRCARAQAEGGAVRLLAWIARAVVDVLWSGLLERLSDTKTRGRKDASMLETIRQDVRFAIRSLRKNPGFALAAVAVIALGIGGVTAIFSALNAFFFRPLPFADPERLVTIGEDNPEFGWVHEAAAPANLLDWRDRIGAFTDVSGYLEPVEQVTTFRNGEPVLVGANAVLGNFFTTLGVPAAIGRTFRFEETWAGTDNVVVISHDLWVNGFGADPDILGKTVQFANHTPEIVGVMPEGFRFPSDATELWYPMGWGDDFRGDVAFRRAHFVRAFARLEPGVSHAEADAELQAVVRALQEEYPATNSVMGAGIKPMREYLVGEVGTPLRVLLGAVSLLLLLACANVANLMLVRASGRGREVAVRHALGAGRLRVARQMFTESLVLAFLGGGLGLAIGWIGVRWLSLTTRLGIDGATTLALDHRVVLFTVAAATLSGLLFGLAPALRAMAGDVHQALRDGGRGGSAASAGLRTAGALVSVEVALALLLAVGAGLMVRSYWRLGRVDPGFRTEGVLAVRFAVQSARYPERDQVLAFYDRFAEALEAKPGIERVGVVGGLPLTGTSYTSQFQAEGWPPDRVGFEVAHRRADNGYFDALEIPLVSGRMFEPTDVADGPRVLLVNETFARDHFPGRDPLGRRVAFDRQATAESTWWEIVGVVADQRQENLATPARPEVFEHRDQEWGRFNWIVVRGAGEAMDLLPAVRATLHELDPLIPIARARTLREVRQESMAREEFVLTLLGVFGVVALLLAAVGVYGVTAQATRRRTQEIGVRMALGAAAPDVLALMLRKAAVVVGIGLVTGLAAALLATRALSSLLYEVEPTDPVTLAAVVALLGAVALAACYVPARRATSIDPVRSLRAE